jgi:hypothetical protein
LSTSVEHPPILTRAGKHSPAEWIRLLFALQAEGFSGELSLRSGTQARDFLVINGHLMDFRSSHRDEGLAKTVVKAKLVEQKVVLDLNDQQTEWAIVDESLLAQNTLEAHFEDRLKMGIVAGLIQNTGSWEIKAKPALGSVEISKALYPKLDLWNVLWGGVKIHLQSKDLQAWAGKENRLFRRSKKLALPYVEAANTAFLKECRGCESLEEFLRATENAETTAARIWILAAAGIFDLLDASQKAAERSPIANPLTTEPAVDSAPTMSRTALPTIPKPTGNQAADIVAEHTQRMGRDYYAFLGLPPTASAEELRDLSRSMAQRLNALSRAPALALETKVLVQDMLSGVQRVYGTFTDRTRKEDYDRQLGLGTAAIIVERGPVS